MKSAIFFVSGIFLLGVVNSCSDTKSDSSVEKPNKDFIYKNYFLLEAIPKTLDPHDDLKQLSEFNDIPDSLLDNWVNRFRAKGQRGNKMISYQFRGSSYHAVIIGLIDELYIDDDNDGEDNSYSFINQYLLTVNDSGKFIDGLKVQEYIPGGDLDSLINGKLILNKKIWSEFNQDTIVVNDRTSYLKETVLSEREDFIDTPQGKKMGKLQTVLNEEFEGTDKSTYLIDSNGKLKKLAEQKGELKKLSEQTGELIKG